jgi:hypothetical protein
VANPYPNREIDLNESILVAAFRVLRRQPWKTFATTTWETVSRLFLSALFAISLTTLLATAAQARTYEAFTVDVPFKFHVGNRTFRPGHYQFIFAGPGLLAVRDAKANVIATLVTRSIETGKPSPDSKVVFRKHDQLAQIWIGNRTQVVEILGEELAIRQPAPPPVSVLPKDVDSLFDRRSAPGFKQ